MCTWVHRCGVIMEVLESSQWIYWSLRWINYTSARSVVSSFLTELDLNLPEHFQWFTNYTSQSNLRVFDSVCTWQEYMANYRASTLMNWHSSHLIRVTPTSYYLHSCAYLSPFKEYRQIHWLSHCNIYSLGEVHKTLVKMSVLHDHQAHKRSWFKCHKDSDEQYRKS